MEKDKLGIHQSNNEIEKVYQEIEKYFGKKIKKKSIFQIDKNTEIYAKLVDLHKRYGMEDIWDVMDEKVLFDEEELKDVFGYLMHPKKCTYETYEDVSRPYRICQECFNIVEQENKFMMKPTSSIRRWNHNCNVFAYDDEDEIFLSLPMYRYLLENQIEENNFQEVLTKRRKVIAYQLKGNNRLERGAYMDGEYICRGVCPICNQSVMDHTEDNYYYQKKYLNMSLINKWADVNYTSENYMWTPKIIISVPFYNLVKNMNLKVYFEPVFRYGSKTFL